MMMISLEDCIAMCGLEEEEIAAICEHEHIGEVPAAALASYLLHQEHGAEKIRAMIIDDIRESMSKGRPQHAAELLTVLRHFLQHHPEAGQDLAEVAA
jgi:aryl-alcohol dehydrogenase-like predicted oxidoreductase